MNEMRRRRVMSDLSQSDLAVMAGLHINTISRYERDLECMNVRNLRKIAAALGCTMSDLLAERRN